MASTNPVTIETSPYTVDLSSSMDAQDEEPGEQQISAWLQDAMTELGLPAAEVSVRLVDEIGMTTLNQQYRGRATPTNVLAFESGMAAIDGVQLLGDIVICTPVVLSESIEYNRTFQERFAHMLIHGLLHLLGYDHLDPQEQQQMEALETQLMAVLQFGNPYEAGV